MTATFTCPRCGHDVRAPGLWSDAWTCPVHGGVAPLHAALTGSDEALHHIGLRSQVPVWLPWPLPAGWLVSGLQVAGDDHTGPVATVLACSGPNPLVLDPTDEHEADLLLVAEQPGVGLAAHLAGMSGIDPGDAIARASATQAPNLKLVAAGHDTPMWAVSAAGTGDPDDPDSDPGLAAYVGEAAGVWLWAIAWPQTAAAVLLEQFELVDARSPDHLYDLPYGALSRRLA